MTKRSLLKCVLSALCAFASVTICSWGQSFSFQKLPFMALQTTALAPPVAYWALNESSGTRADATGNGLNLVTNSVAITQGTGPITNGAFFTLNSPGLQGSNARYQIIGSRTFTGWFYTTSLSFDQPLIGKWDDAGGGGFNDDYVLLFTGGVLNFVARKSDNSASVTVVSTIPIVVNTFFFFACGFDAANGQIWISVNNEPSVTAAISSVQATSTQFRLGSTVDWHTLGTKGLDGSMDEVGMWNRMLSRTELTNLYATLSYTGISRGDTVAGWDNAARWCAQVQINGAAIPSATSSNAFAGFVNSCVSSGVYSKLLMWNLMLPDSIIACGTPWGVQRQASTWVNHGFVNGDVTVNGLTGNGTKYFDAQFNTAALDPDNAGISLYGYTVISGASREIGNYVLATGSGFLLDLNGSDLAPAGANVLVGQETSGVHVSPSPGNGFYSGNRVNNTDLRMYFANSGSAFAQVGTVNTTARSAALLNGTANVMSINIPTLSANFEPTSDTISYSSFHKGFSSGEAQAEYNAAQAARVTLTGGFR